MGKSDNKGKEEVEKLLGGGVPLIVSGCADATISGIIAGNYIPHSQNHGKVVYKREGKSKGLDILIYFWDDRDGAELCGWWFGPSVGGEQVWAYHPSCTAATPPASEWNVPHDGEIDPSFSVKANRVGNEEKKSEKSTKADEPPAKKEKKIEKDEPKRSEDEGKKEKKSKDDKDK